jgi:hypothetical protein
MHTSAGKLAKKRKEEEEKKTMLTNRQKRRGLSTRGPPRMEASMVSQILEQEM